MVLSNTVSADRLPVLNPSFNDLCVILSELIEHEKGVKRASDVQPKWTELWVTWGSYYLHLESEAGWEHSVGGARL